MNSHVIQPSQPHHSRRFVVVVVVVTPESSGTVFVSILAPQKSLSVFRNANQVMKEPCGAMKAGLHRAAEL